MWWRLLVALFLVVITTANCGNSISPTAVGTGGASGPSSGGGSTNPNPTPTPPPTSGSGGLNCLSNRGTMSALIDGTPWVATCLQAASWMANTLSIVATDGIDTITIGAIASVPGSMDLTTGAAFGTVTRGAGIWTTASSAGTGTLTFSRLDLQSATGTFSFVAPAVPGTVAIGAKIVSNGVFDVTF